MTRLLPLSLLIACAPAELAGTWQGRVYCDSENLDEQADLDLLIEGDAEQGFTGELIAERWGDLDVGSAVYEFETNYTAALVIEPLLERPASDNLLGISGEYTSCDYEMDGEDVTEQYCQSEGSLFEMTDMVPAWTDREAVTMLGTYCDGTLTRDEE